LIATMASIRRSARRLARRPPSLATLTGAQLELVRLVRRQPEISVSEAALALRLVPNTVSTLVGQLSEAGMLRRIPDQVDRRIIRLQLAPGTRRKVDAWLERRLGVLSDAVQRLSVGDRRRLAQALPVLEHLAEMLEGEQEW
jgi:DNA-binding MarR family transcriptional regulator